MTGSGPGIDWQRRLEQAAPGLVQRPSVVAVRARSVVLRGHSPEFGDVGIKYDTTPAGRARVEAEYAALQACQEAGGTGAFGFPRPCALVTDGQGGAALVTGWIPCPRGNDRLARSLHFGSAREELLRRAAGWLAFFHGLWPEGDAPLRSMLDTDRLARQLRGMPGLGAADAAGGPLERMLERLGDSPVRLARLHDDFLPQNIFLCPDRTIGFDFTLDVVGPALRDVGHFLANIVWRGYSVLDPRRSARFARDVGIFLETYGGGATVPDGARLFVIAELAKKADALSGKIGRAGPRIPDRLHRRMVVDAIRHLMRDEIRALA